jgi:hypothetical protein
MRAVLWPILAVLAAAPVGAQEPPSGPTPQAAPRRVDSGAFAYARIGYGRVLGEGGAADPVIGFGARARNDRFGLDISFLNVSPSARGVGVAPGATAVSLLKIEALYFLGPAAHTSVYLGGGVSWGSVSGYDSTPSSSSSSPSNWNGSGMQGELTAGYELPRAGRLRVFVQTDATLPFYRTVGQSYDTSNGQSIAIVTGRRYNPSIALSLGVGWRLQRP